MSSEQPILGPGPVPKEFAAAVRALTEYADAKGIYESE